MLGSSGCWMTGTEDVRQSFRISESFLYRSSLGSGPPRTPNRTELNRTVATLIRTCILAMLLAPSSILGSAGSWLPHEWLFLNHLPSADQYHKSFIHHNMINLVIVTQYVSFFYQTFHTMQNTGLMFPPPTFWTKNAAQTLSSRCLTM